MQVLPNDRKVFPSTVGYKLDFCCSESKEKKNAPLLSSFVTKQVNPVEEYQKSPNCLSHQKIENAPHHHP